MKDAISKFVDYIQEERWFAHVLFWVTFLLIQVVGVESQYASRDEFVHHGIVLLPKMLAAYSLIYYLIPEFLYKKRYVLFFVLLLFTSYVFSAMARIMVVHIVEELIRPRPFRQEPIQEILTDIKRLYKHYYIGVYLPAFIMYMFKLISEKFNKKSQIEQLEKEKVSAELNFFKAQIHPHFLFNTLNNLYTLTLQKSDKAADTVLKLSEILDYMLYQCNDNRVSVEKEVSLVQNYIDLEHLRYGDRLQLSFEKNIDQAHTQIAPLILISLVENAFKHGASGAIRNPVIKINLKVAEQQLEFSIYNTKATIAQEDRTNFKKGIGLSNTESQLELLYPGKHHLEIMETETSFEVKLNVDLRP